MLGLYFYVVSLRRPRQRHLPYLPTRRYSHQVHVDLVASRCWFFPRTAPTFATNHPATTLCRSTRNVPAAVSSTGGDRSVVFLYATRVSIQPGLCDPVATLSVKFRENSPPVSLLSSTSLNKLLPSRRSYLWVSDGLGTLPVCGCRSS